MPDTRRLTLYTLLQQVRCNPLEHLPAKTLPCLEALFDGLLHALYDQGVLTQARVQDSTTENFYRWLAKKYGAPVTRSAFAIATLVGRDDASSFDLFFEELEEFLQTHPGNEMWTGMLIAEPPTPKPAAFDLDVLLKQIRKHPEMHLKARTITILRAYLDGQVWARKTCVDNLEIAPNLDEFGAWLRTQSPRLISGPLYRWERILLFQAGQHESEHKAFDLFFSVYDRWRAHQKNREASGLGL